VLPLCNKDSNLKPESGPEKRLVGAIAYLYSQLPAESAWERVLGQIGEPAGCFITRSLYAGELESFVVPHEIGTVARVEKIMRHRGFNSRVSPAQ
jgi:hypothetical protein